MPLPLHNSGRTEEWRTAQQRQQKREGEKKTHADRKNSSLSSLSATQLGAEAVKGKLTLPPPRPANLAANNNRQQAPYSVQALSLRMSKKSSLAMFSPLGMTFHSCLFLSSNVD